VDRCPVAAPALNEALAALRRMLPQPRFPRFLRSIELFTNGSEVQVNALDTGGARLAKGFFEWLARHVPGANRPALEYAAAGDRFRVGHRSFFQTNRFLVDVMAEAAMAGLEGETALDLYAGVGLFSLPLARRFREVTAVESSAGAVADLRFNAERAGLPVRVVRGTAELFLESVERRPDLLFADPPRTGIGKGVVREALRLRPPEIVVVSCDPATAARDVALLLAGGYRLRDCALVDLFPQTFHIESVIRLSAG
jgi:23S rRNA (uracil1939-C5)-methyltransferase